MKKLKYKTNSIGIGLLELLLAISIIAILITLASRYFIITQASQKTNEATEIMNNLAAAGEKWLTTHNDYDTLSLKKLQERNYFPETVEKNPWGGDITAKGSTNTLTITLNAIPQSNCLLLAQKLLPITCNPSDYKAEDFCSTAPGGNSNYAVKITQPQTCYDKTSTTPP